MSNNYIPMSEAAPLLSIAGEKNYRIKLPETDHIIIRFGQDPRKPIGGYTHPNLIGKRLTVHEFKRYLPNGGKRWTQRPGIDFYFAVPTDKVLVLAKPGYSYVDILINGVKASLNVSGGGNGAGWTDCVREMASVSVGHSKRDMDKIAEVCTPLTRMLGLGWTFTKEHGKYADPEHERKNFAGMLFEKKIRATLKKGDTIIAGESTTLAGSELTVNSFRNSPFNLIAGYYKIRSTQVDWLKTGLNAGMQMPETDEFRMITATPPQAAAKAS